MGGGGSIEQVKVSTDVNRNNGARDGGMEARVWSGVGTLD